MFFGTKAIATSNTFNIILDEKKALRKLKGD